MENKEERVYNLLKRIPKGKVTTYGIISRKTGLSPKEVGRILSRNKHPIEFPCYKVVMSDGTVGGYTIGGRNDESTAKRKIQKLHADKVIFNKGKIAKKSLYDFDLPKLVSP